MTPAVANQCGTHTWKGEEGALDVALVRFRR